MKKNRPARRSARLLTLALAAAATALPQSAARGDEAAESMAEAAQRFLASLDDKQRASATFKLDDKVRTDWHFIPKARKGLVLKSMKPDQRQLAHVLLSSGLSQGGYAKAVTVMTLEQVLHELENNAPHRDPELYYICIFGQPDPEGTWAWSFEGHHLSLNFTIVKGQYHSGTPAFYGSNPAEIRSGKRKGLRALAREEDLGRALLKSLDAGQKKQAIIADKAPRDILTSAQPKVEHLGDEGIAYTALKPDQKELLQELVEAYVEQHRPRLAELDLAQIKKAGFDKVVFAWAGAENAGGGHYYRVQGPTFLLEYANTQNNANHVHAVWRDMANDFGRDLLRKHYAEAH